MKLRSMKDRAAMKAGKPKKKVKFGNKLKMPKHLREARDESDGKPEKKKKKVSSGEGADWATTDATAISGQIETNQTLSSQNRPPEFYLLNSGDKKRIRFRSSEPLASFFQYGVKLGPKAYKDFTKPRDGDRDLFAEKGLNASLKVLWEVIDLDGYVDRQQQKHRFIPKFWRVGTRLNGQIMAMLEQYGSLTNRVVTVKRVGKGQDTTYTLFADDRSKPHPKEEAAERLNKKFREFYAPPSLAVQKSIIGTVRDPNAKAPADDDDEPPF